MSFGSAPKAPDYTAAAEKQGESSQALTTQQTWANRPDLYTPWGSQTWNSSQQIDPATGKPVTSWSSSIQLSPEQQQALDSQMRIQQGRSQGAETLLGQAVGNFQTPMDWSKLPALSGQLSGGSDEWRQKAQDAMTQMQAPMRAQRRDQLESQLANMGLTRGSEQWNNEMQRLGDQEARDDFAAIGAGRDESNSMFAQALQSANFNNQNRQQAIAEGNMQRGQTLNELNALLTGQQVNMPNMPGFQNATKADTTNYMGAAQNQYGAAMDKFNADQAGMSSMMSGAFGLGSAAMGAGGWGSLFSMSDERLKTDIKKLFTLPNGVEIYTYRFRNNDYRQIGALAQQVQKVMPDAVRRGGDGFLRVNYNMVLE